MRASSLTCHLAGTLLLTSTLVGFARADDNSDARAFVGQYCLDCHTADDPAGEREFDTLSFAGSSIDGQLRLQEVIDQLTLGAMPLEDADQPSEEERLQAIRTMTRVLARMRSETNSTGGDTVLRRLTRREYINTVGDLLGIDMTMFDPTREFPADAISEGFDNVGDHLTTSGFLLEKYLDAADACVEKALAALERPAPQSWTFKDNFYQQPEVDPAHRRAFNRRYMVLYDHPLNDKPEGAFGPLNNFRQGVPADGLYEVRVKAQALHRDTPYSSRAVQIDTSEPFRMGIRPGDARVGDLYKTQPIQPKVAEAVIADNEVKWYTFQVPLDRGFSPRFTFENGQNDVRGASARVFRYHKETFPPKVQNSTGIVARRIAAIQHGFYPQIRIHEVRIRGPLPESSQRRIAESLFGTGNFEASQVREHLELFVTRAFRRPAKSDDVERFAALYSARQEGGRSPLDAYKDALKAVLCSPEFLYFSPPEDAAMSSLSQHALAERLAYFLTSSMPDERLRELAGEGSLISPDVLRAETERLLASQQSDRFVTDFLDSWLNLRSLGSMPPDQSAFSVYYTANLEPEMKRETQLFFRDLIDRNGSLLECLSADHSFANRDLAKLYGVTEQIPVDDAGQFHRVVFSDENRGGLLGQASVLTVSANGIETSPVVRGVWLLERVLGTPPPPPPDDVPAIDPDVRGAESVRDLLDKHRSSAACNDCHRKIDPLGFALEGFDPIGRSRRFYDSKRQKAIDTSGVLPSGDHFADLAGLKKILLEQEEFFVRAVVNRLLTHALGRHIEPTDRAAVDDILAQCQEGNYATQDVIVAIVTSPLFSSR